MIITLKASITGIREEYFRVDLELSQAAHVLYFLGCNPGTSLRVLL